MGCGICGVAHTARTAPLDRAGLRAMRDTLWHRGPDDGGEFVSDGIELGVRRLAILDLSERGHMPMTTADGRYTIAYNGEVYNYRELRASLEQRGVQFRSDTDTEVVLEMYAAWGPAILERLNGMFGFAIWDAATHSLFLARDRMGVKPLYYAEHAGAFYFASEAKALFNAGVPATFDPGTWEELLCFRFVAGERTPFAGVRRLLPGHYLLWTGGRIDTRPWWRLADRAADRRQDLPGDPLEWFRETLKDAVSLRRISDVPLGVLLSGGLDSASIAAIVSDQAGPGVAGFNVRFAEQGYDEGPVAKATAERFALSYHGLTQPVETLPDLLDEAAWLSDEPIVHGSDLHILAISRYAKPRVTVLLSGEGGDELLGGYVRYMPLRYPRLLSASRMMHRFMGSRSMFGGRARKLARLASLGSTDRAVLFNSCDVLPEDLEGLGIPLQGHFEYREDVLGAGRALYPGEPLRQAMYLDQHTFLCSLLDRNDRMTMGASIECRPPFLDYRLVEGIAALPTATLLRGGRKGLLRCAMGERLPAAVLRYRKWGFAVPWSRYLRELPAFRQLVIDLPTLEPVKSGPFDLPALRNATRTFIAGDDRLASLMRALVNVTLWHQTFMQSARSRETTRPVAASVGSY